MSRIFTSLNCTGYFDIVIGNPPYGANIDPLVKIFEILYPKTSHGYKDIYKYFFDKGLSLLINTGNLCFITPNTFLRQPRYGDLRRLLLEKGILEIIDLGENIFEAVVPTAISLISMKYNQNVLFADLSTENNVNIALLNIDFTIIMQNLFLQTANNIFVKNVRLKQENEYLLDDILEIKDCGFKYQRSNVGMAQKGKSDLAERIFYSGKKENKYDIPILTGKDINSYYYTNTPDKKLRQNYTSLLKHNEGTYYNKKMMNEKYKLIWRQTAPYFIGTILTEKIFFGNTIQAGVIKEGFKDKISYEFLCGLLNSRYLRYLYEQNVKEEGRVFPQVKLEKLKNLPIIIPEKTQQKQIVNLVSSIISKKENNPQVDTTNHEVRIDNIIYRLYNLTYEEVKIIEPNFSLSKKEYEND